MKIPSQDISLRGRDLNSELLAYEAGVLATRSRRSGLDDENMSRSF
jgi:hypothetical protein